MPVNMKKLLEGMLKLGASDLHLKVGQKPTIRLHGILRAVEHPVLTPEDTIEANKMMMPERLTSTFEELGSVDFSYGLSLMQRFRVNAYHQRNVISLAIRTVSSKIPTFEDLNLPLSIQAMTEYHRGLVLVTGITGSGKSSTLSAMISLINRTRREHVITIEDPIEFLYEDDRCIIEQIEVGSDILDFRVAMRHALRQDPDIILLGELRDRDSVETALHCVETGHLVLSTLHTPDAKQTIMRLLHFFPVEEHGLVNEQLAMNLKGVVCQRLVKTIDGQGRVPVCEVMFGTPIVQKLIREKRYDDLGQVLVNAEDDMQAFDSHLIELVKDEIISVDEAIATCHDDSSFVRMLKGRAAGGDRRQLIG